MGIQRMSAGGFTVVSFDDKVVVNGENIPLPKGMKTGSQSIVGGKLFIGGYEYIESEKAFRKVGTTETVKKIEDVGTIKKSIKTLLNLFR